MSALVTSVGSGRLFRCLSLIRAEAWKGISLMVYKSVWHDAWLVYMCRYSTLEWVKFTPVPNAPPRAQRTINCLKAGIVASNGIVTVSQNYAAEICAQDGKDQDSALSSLLTERSAVLRGIVNGIDTVEWNPEADPYLPAQYNMDNLKVNEWSFLSEVISVHNRRPFQVIP